ncbi:MAG: nuclear transport factor 2 family protein, partial [Gammaproteobacteria bacterium]|nr:nuclear transport factor 2 family protein [Gammaproteobacteria bacterium]
MNNYQSEKRLILDFYNELDLAKSDEIVTVLDNYIVDNYIWRGFHPFNEQSSVKVVSEMFWQPLRHAFRHMQRRIDIFMAGRNAIDGFESVWVTSMGHLMGLFDNEWLGITPSGKMVFLRYCEFNKVENGKITETAMFFDIPHLMIQVGLSPFPTQTAAHLVQPGPMTHDGLMFEEQSQKESEKTLAAIDFMVNDLKTWKDPTKLPLVEELRRSWNEDMIWWGPAGIGSTYTIDRYAEQHSGPFRARFTDR